MRYELVDYQREAAVEVLKRLRRGHDDWVNHDATSSFALSAITGAGKTVIATAVIEAMLFGSSDLGAEPDPTAVFLWITDDPALNRQTRIRMLDASDQLTSSTLNELDDGFLDAELKPWNVYFLNTQKLSKSSRLVQKSNLRQRTFWEVLANTISAKSSTLYLILDEAHRGMRRTPDRATIDRFRRAMAGIKDFRTNYPPVEVDIEKVRASGLVKDEIGLDQPDEEGTFSTTLLRDAVKTVRDYDSRWAAYSTAEGEPEVLPALVIQVPDKSDAAKIGDIVQVVESEWPGLGTNAIAHVFGEHEPIVLGSRTIRWVYPESIQSESDIRVVLAKEAISTGWDCPRAEVLYSERPAKDSTHIAQVLGRMVRQPLAHRIATDDVLNSVSCFLPLFDRQALSLIKQELEGKGKDNGENKVGPEVVRAPKIFERNPTLEPEVFAFIETLPSIPPPDSLANPLRRAKNLVRLLADDISGKALLDDADALLTQTLNSRLDGLSQVYAHKVEKNVTDLKTVQVTRSKVNIIGEDAGEESRVIETHARDIDRDARRIISGVKEGIGKNYYAYRVKNLGEDADRLAIKVEVAALFQVDAVIEELESAATKFVQDHLAKFAVDIKNTTGATRDAFRKVQEQTSAPEALTIDLRLNEKAPTKNGDGQDLLLFSSHIYSDPEGLFPAQFNNWEEQVVRTEIARPTSVAWYRNPQRSTPNALRIAYQDDGGRWASLQVDFLVVSRKDDGGFGAAIVDPHGDHLADAKAKLRALADFAERHGGQFVRIESVAKVASGGLRSLDLLEEKVREAVREFEGAEVTSLYESGVAQSYE